MAKSSLTKYPHTPDGRYFVAAGKLWRTSNPSLTDKGRNALTKKLMAARREVKLAGADQAKVRAARRKVHVAKVDLGERGPVWWNDGAPDENNMAPRNSTYAEWWANLDDDVREAGKA